jgi:hypothetical protein
LQACAEIAPNSFDSNLKEFGVSVKPEDKLYFNEITKLASDCGLPAETVKLTPNYKCDAGTQVVQVVSTATYGAYAPGGFMHAVLCVVTLMASSLGMEKY